MIRISFWIKEKKRQPHEPSGPSRPKGQESSENDVVPGHDHQHTRRGAALPSTLKVDSAKLGPSKSSAFSSIPRNCIVDLYFTNQSR